MIKVSLIVPVYKVERYIERCLESIIRQSYPNIECIFIDDCSPDNSMELITQKLCNYTGTIQFKIVHHEVNKGLSEARNTGVKCSTGNYLYFLDSDDELVPNAIEEFKKIAETYPDVQLIQGNAYFAPGYEWLSIPATLSSYYEDSLLIKKIMLSKVIPPTSWNKLISRTFFVKNDLWFKAGIIHEDEYWNFFAAKHIQTLAVCRQPTYVYYINDGSIMNSMSIRSIDSLLIILDSFVRNIDPVLTRIQKKAILQMGLTLIAKLAANPDKIWTEKTAALKITFKPLLKIAISRLHISEVILLLFFGLPFQSQKFFWKHFRQGLYFILNRFI